MLELLILAVWTEFISPFEEHAGVTVRYATVMRLHAFGGELRNAKKEETGTKASPPLFLAARFDLCGLLV